MAKKIKNTDMGEFKEITGKTPNSTGKSVSDILAEAKEKKIAEVQATNPKEDIKTQESHSSVSDTKSQIYVAHGALNPDQSNNINAILKKFKRGPYDKYNSTEEYAKAINTMSLNELHNHAIEVAIIPTSDKVKLVRNLENAFGIYINKTAPRSFPPTNITVQNKDAIEEILARKMPNRI